MTLVRWDPTKRVANLQDRINRMFDDTFTRTRDLDDELAMCAWQPAVDIYETEEGMVLKAELPGISKENVSVEIKDNVLTIKGERSADKNIREENYYRQERCFGTFYRSFTLRDPIDPNKINAKFKDGVLELKIPEPEEEKPKQIKVDIG